MKNIAKLYVYCDGACRHVNGKGPASIAVMIYDEQDNLLRKYGEFIGEGTNNVAEYKAVEKGVDLACGYCKIEVYIYSDSQLVVNQLKKGNKLENSGYRLRAQHLIPIHDNINTKAQKYNAIYFNYLNSKNDRIKLTDKLSKDCLKNRKKIDIEYERNL